MSGRVRTGIDPKKCKKYVLDIVGRGLCELFFDVVFVEDAGSMRALHDTGGYVRVADAIADGRRGEGLTVCDVIEIACILADKIIAAEDRYIEAGSFVITEDTLWIKRETDRGSGVVTTDVKLIWVQRDVSASCPGESAPAENAARLVAPADHGRRDGEKYVKASIAGFLHYCLEIMKKYNDMQGSEADMTNGMPISEGSTEAAMKRALEIAWRERSSLRMTVHRLKELRKELMLAGSRLSTGRSGPHRQRDPLQIRE